MSIEYDDDLLAKNLPITFFYSPLAGDISLVLFSESDLPSVIAINQAVDVTPWSEKNYRDSFAAKHFCISIKKVHRVIGFAVLQHKTQDAELLQIAVLPEFQGRGLGKLLVKTMIAQVEKKCERLFLEVRESNQQAISFYDGLGFNEMGIRKNYYPIPRKNKRENAYIFGLELLPETE